jgi:pimeloyl-ACP methyl ester carboxylesterase
MERVTVATGLDLDVLDEGQGEPLLLIMGLGSQLVFWPPGLLDELRARGFRTIRFDNRDAGRSTWLDDAPVPSIPRAIVRAYLGLPVPAPYTLWDLADDAAGLLDALGLASAHVLGVSLGGMVAQCLAIRHPGRVRTLTSIMATPGGRRGWLATPLALRAITSPVPADPARAIEREVGIFRVIAGRGYPFDEPLLRGLLEEQVARGVNPAGFVRQLVAVLASGDRRAALGTLRLPTLVVHGAEDPLILPWAGRATALAIPGARLVVHPGMGHSLPRPLWPVLADDVARLAGLAAAS